MNDLIVYATYILIAPFAFTGVYTIVVFFDRIMKVKKGYVRAEAVNKSGRRKCVFVKPKDFVIKMKGDDGEEIFQYDNQPGFLITSERGVPTVVFDHNRQQLNFFGEKLSNVDNDFIDKVAMMGINQGLASRTKKDATEELIKWATLIGAAGAALICIFIAKQGNDILTLLRSLVG